MSNNTTYSPAKAPFLCNFCQQVQIWGEFYVQINDSEGESAFQIFFRHDASNATYRLKHVCLVGSCARRTLAKKQSLCIICIKLYMLAIILAEEDWGEEDQNSPLKTRFAQLPLSEHLAFLSSTLKYTSIKLKIMIF